MINIVIPDIALSLNSAGFHFNRKDRHVIGFIAVWNFDFLDRNTFFLEMIELFISSEI